MHTIATTLHHKVMEPQRKTQGRSPALVLLHGRGSNEDDLLSLAEYLDERLFIVSARAPFPFHGGGSTWYDIVDIGQADPKMFQESYTKLVQFLADVKKGYPILPEKVILFGFSMGATMSYAVALTDSAAAQGVVAASGYIPEGAPLEYKWAETAHKPFFVSHGLFDPIIPVSFARRAKELLMNAHAEITYREYEMGHQISEDCLNDVMQWLTKHL